MKKLYFLFFVTATLCLSAQTTINYPQNPGNYTNFEDGGGTYDSGGSEVGMWANFSAKQIAAFRNFTETGLPGGTASTMESNANFIKRIFVVISEKSTIKYRF